MNRLCAMLGHAFGGRLWLDSPPRAWVCRSCFRRDTRYRRMVAYVYRMEGAP